MIYQKLGRTKDNIPIQPIGVNEGKQIIMNRLTIDKPGPLYFHFPLDEPGIMDTRGYDDLYMKGLISERRKTVKKNGTYQEIWEPVGGVRNEPLDLRNYNLAAMRSLNIDWDHLKAINVNGTPPQEWKPKKKPAKRIVQATANTNIW